MTGPLELKKTAYNIFFELNYGSLGNTWAFFIFSLPLLFISPFLWLKHVHQVSSPVSKLEMTQQFLQKFPVIFKVLCLMLLSEQMRYPPSANLSQVQTLFSKLSSDMPVQLAISLTDNRSILFDHNLY